MCFLFLSGLFKGSMLVCGVENWPSFIHCYYSIHRINIRSPVSTPVNPTEPLQVCLVFWSGSQTLFLRGTEMQGFGNAKKCLEMKKKLNILNWGISGLHPWNPWFRFSPLKDSGVEANIRDKGMPKRLHAHMWGISEGSVMVFWIGFGFGSVFFSPWTDGSPWSSRWIWSMVKKRNQQDLLKWSVLFHGRGKHETV